MAKKESDQKLRREFYTFQGKVNRLEELRRELQSLQAQGFTKGFEKEVSIIQSRLKDTTAIPELEKMIKELREKILNKREVKKKSPLKEIKKDIEKVADVNVELKREIKNLKSTITDGLNKKSNVDSDVGVVVDKEFQDFVKDVKLELSEKVKNKEKQLNEELKRDLILRKEQLESHYKELEDKLKQQYKGKLKEGLQKEISERFDNELKKRFEAERARIDDFYITKIKQKYQEEAEKQKMEYEGRLKDKLIELNKQRQLQFTSIQGFKNQIKKQLAEEAHNKLINEIELHKKKLDSELKKQFAVKINNFALEQRKRHEREIENKVNEMKQALDKERRERELLDKELSAKKEALERQKQRIKEIISRQSEIKHNESMKRDLEHKTLAENHKKDIEESTEKLKNEFNSRMELEFKKRVNEEKSRLEKDFDSKKREISEQLIYASLNERNSIKNKLKQEYKDELRRAIESEKKKLFRTMNINFANQLKINQSEQKKKFEEDLRKINKNYLDRERSIKEKEQQLLDAEKKKDIKYFSEQAHNEMIKELEKRSRLINLRLLEKARDRERYIELKNKNYLDKKQAELSQKLENQKKALEESFLNEEKLNDLLKTKLIDQSHAIEKQRAINKELINKQSRIKQEIGLKREEEHRDLVEKHKKEVRDISEKLKKEFHDRFDAEIKKHINEEKLRLVNEFDLKKRELMHKSQDISSKEREELKAKLRKDYEIALNKSIEQRKKKLQDSLRSEYGKRVNEKILFEKRKLENKLKEMQSRHDAREAELKIKEKRLLEEAKTRAMELASEKRQLLGKLNLFKKEEDVRLKNERIKMQKELTEKAHQHMLDEMKSREALIKSKLEKQFEQRLKDVSRHHDQILARKKAELAGELQKKARALLG
ncbi:hypothetical protein HYW74_03725 [Candidatus Pacearchaeota archaeon]|nr:hypothetical protein [Candidatus Pacearchaeota archaeon]